MKRFDEIIARDFFFTAGKRESMLYDSQSRSINAIEFYMHSQNQSRFMCYFLIDRFLFARENDRKRMMKIKARRFRFSRVTSSNLAAKNFRNL